MIQLILLSNHIKNKTNIEIDESPLAKQNYSFRFNVIELHVQKCFITDADVINLLTFIKPHTADYIDDMNQVDE